MQPNKVLFFGIIGLALIVVIALFLARSFVTEEFNSVSQGKVAIRVVVAPSIKPWVDQAGQAFNQQNPNTRVEIVAAGELIPQAQFAATGQTSPPTAWLAEAGFVVELARQRGLQFQDAQPVAATAMAWGTFKSKQDEFSQKYGGLNWEGLHAKAISPADQLRFAIASPFNSAEGLAALISATAAHSQKQTLSSADIGQVDTWLAETFRDNAQTPAIPAEGFATKGISAGDAGFLSLMSWRNAHLDQRADFIITLAQPALYLDYPLAIRAGASQAEQEAAQLFRQFLLGEAQQNTLANFGFDRAAAAAPGLQIDGAAVQILFDRAKIILQ